MIRTRMSTAVRRVRKSWYCRQRDAMDCGPACLTMVARYHGSAVAVARVRALCGLDRQGTSLLELSRAAERMGFRAMRVRTTYHGLFEHAPLPAIAHWDQNHFVVIYGRNGNGIRIADPGSGFTVCGESELLAHWARVSQPDGAVGFLLLLEPLDTAATVGTAVRSDASERIALLRRYVLNHRRTLLQVAVGGLAAALLRLIIPFVGRAIVDLGIGQRDLGIIQLLLIAEIVVLVSATGVDFLQGWLLLYLGSRVDMKLVADYLRRLLTLPLSFFDTRPPGDLLQRVEDHARIEQLLSTTSQTIVSAVTSIAVFSSALLVLNVSAFRVVAYGVILQACYVASFLRRRTALDEQRFRLMAAQRNGLNECIAGVADIKIAGAELERRWTWERGQVDLYRTKERSLRLEQIQHGGAILAAELTNAIVTVTAAAAVIDGSLTLGGLIAVQFLVGQVAAPVLQLVGAVQSIQAAGLSLDRLSEVFAGQRETAPAIEPYPSDRDGDITIQDVSFRYNGRHGQLVLRDLSLRIPFGKVTAIVGSSGSGKSTLLKLLLKFYDPSAGQIRFGDVDLRNVDHAAWRARCGAVMQDGRLFSDTIARNIALGADEIDDGRVRTVARQACIADVVEALPLRYETRVGSSGIALSHGQQQRLLIARALYHDPDLLVLDEATSALDAETERAIVGQLEALFRHRTVVIIAHRLSTVRRADQIAVLEGGTVVEIGTHDELARSRGRYHALIRNQLELNQTDNRTTALA